MLSCLTRHAYGKDPGHTHFYYPKKYGYGELWLRMAAALGDHIEYGKTVKGIDFSTKTVATMDGGKYHADVIITTIPWMEFSEIVGMPKDMRESLCELRYSSIQTEYYAESIDTDSQWIYFPDPALPYHRILVRHNFCPNSRGCESKHIKIWNISL